MATKYLYLWQNHMGLTCFGITQNPEKRRRKYEGHTGIPINFTNLWAGPENLIKDLEDKIKTDFFQYLFYTNVGRYEWINNSVPYSDIKNFIDWECKNSYEDLIKAL